MSSTKSMQLKSDLDGPAVPIRNLTQDEIDEFDRNGVVLARSIMPAEWVECTAAAIEQLAENPTPFGKRLSGKGLNSDLFMWKYNELFHKLVYQSPMSRIAQQIMRSERVNFHVDHMFKKNVGCPIPTVWHRDEPAWPVTGSQAVNVWLACEEVRPANSALQFIAGSHKWPLPPKVEKTPGERDIRVAEMLNGLGWKPTPEPEIPADVDPTSMTQVMELAFRGVHRQLEQDMALTQLAGDLYGLVTIESNRDKLPIVTWDVQPGDVLLFGFGTLHFSTGVPDGETTRRGLGTRWTGDDARYEPSVGNIPMFWEHGLRPGDPFGGPVFPQVLPVCRSGEEPAWRGPEEADSVIGFQDICERFSALPGSCAPGS
jgi:ectoine hydroxylase-related dioxygenase (phytanoyl-CoA dioxygenase family)